MGVLMHDPNPYSILDESAAAALAKGRQRVRPIRPVHALRRRAASFAAACRKQTPAVMEKFLFFGGMASVVCGCWMVYHPLGPLVGGGVAVWLGMLVSVEREAK
jgi:hypothetical protein